MRFEWELPDVTGLNHMDFESPYKVILTYAVYNSRLGILEEKESFILIHDPLPTIKSVTVTATSPSDKYIYAGKNANVAIKYDDVDDVKLDIILTTNAGAFIPHTKDRHQVYRPVASDQDQPTWIQDLKNSRPERHKLYTSAMIEYNEKRTSESYGMVRQIQLSHFGEMSYDTNFWTSALNDLDDYKWSVGTNFGGYLVGPAGRWTLGQVNDVKGLVGNVKTMHDKINRAFDSKSPYESFFAGMDASLETCQFTIGVINYKLKLIPGVGDLAKFSEDNANLLIDLIQSGIRSHIDKERQKYLEDKLDIRYVVVEIRDGDGHAKLQVVPFYVHYYEMKDDAGGGQ